MSTIRVGVRPRHTTVDRRTINDERLSFRARGILVWLLDKPDDWRCTSEEIARAGQEGRDAVRAALQELECCRYLVRERAQDADSGFWSTMVTIYERPTDDGFPGVGQPGVGSPVVGEPGAITSTDTEELIPNTSPTDVEGEFILWYLAYPRKTKKADAKKAYIKARKKVDAETLLAGVERLVAHWKTKPASEQRFIPYPASWLNAGCWEDEIDNEPEVGGRPAELLAETAAFFTKYARNVPLDKIEATIGWMMARGYGEGETMMRLGVQAALWPEGLAIPNTVMKIPVTVVPRFPGRARQWDDMPDEPYAVLIERAWRGRKWLCQK